MKSVSIRIAVMSFVLPLLGMATIGSKSCQAAYTQDFANVNTIVNNGDPLKWAWYNKSQDAGSAATDPSVGGWFQGTPADTFDAQSGAANSYARADFSSTSNFGVISNWLITPTFSVNTGDSFSFYTRTIAGSSYPDRLQVLLSQSGTSSDVGADWTTVGNFTDLLLEINPSEASGVYPETWTLYNYTFTGPSFTGRIGFRYYITDTNNNGNYIGLDTFSTSASLYNPVPEPSSYVLALSAIATLSVARYRTLKRLRLTADTTL